MSTLKTEDIEKVAKLAKLSLNESEKDGWCNDLNNVLGFFNQLKAANINSNLEPLVNPTDVEFSAREDRVEAFSESPEKLLSNAPETQGRLYKTPPIV